MTDYGVWKEKIPRFTCSLPRVGVYAGNREEDYWPAVFAPDVAES